MKTLLVVLSASVLAGLGVYAMFNAAGLLGLIGNNVTMHVDSFVWLLAALTLATSAVTLGLRELVARGDRAAQRSLEQRVAELENRASPRINA